MDSRQQPETAARPREANPARTAVKLTPCTREEQAARLERLVTARKALEGLPQLAWTCRDLMLEEESLRQGLAADQRSIGVRLDAARKEVTRKERAVVDADVKVRAAEEKLVKVQTMRVEAGEALDASREDLRGLEVSISKDEAGVVASAAKVLAQALDGVQLTPAARFALDLIQATVNSEDAEHNMRCDEDPESSAPGAHVPPRDHAAGTEAGLSPSHSPARSALAASDCSSSPLRRRGGGSERSRSSRGGSPAEQRGRSMASRVPTPSKR